MKYFLSIELTYESKMVPVGYGFGGAPIGIAGLGIGGGCGIGGALFLLEIMQMPVNVIERLLFVL